MWYCDLCCVTVIRAEIFVTVTQRNFSYIFSEERCIFQGGSLTSIWRYQYENIFWKSIIYYQTLKIQSRKLKKLHRDVHFNMKKKKLEVVTYLFLELLTTKLKYLGIKVSKKSNFYLILCFFLDDIFCKIERDGKLFRKRCQDFTSHTLSRWLYEDITCSGLFINKKQKASDT